DALPIFRWRGRRAPSAKAGCGCRERECGRPGRSRPARRSVPRSAPRRRGDRRRAWGGRSFAREDTPDGALVLGAHVKLLHGDVGELVVGEGGKGPGGAARVGGGGGHVLVGP